MWYRHMDDTLGSSKKLIDMDWGERRKNCIYIYINNNSSYNSDNNNDNIYIIMCNSHNRNKQSKVSKSHFVTFVQVLWPESLQESHARHVGQEHVWIFVVLEAPRVAAPNLMSIGYSRLCYTMVYYSYGHKPWLPWLSLNFLAIWPTMA